ncbi:MAG: SPOR domain-containing protein [Parashewanella sp.]
MSRDYANRKPKARKTSRANKSSTPSRGFPILLLVSVLIAVIGFGYFLWSIKDSAKNAPKPATVKTKPVKKDELPPKPKDQWQYQDMLENKQVEVDLPEKSNKPQRPYQMQCGSFRTQSQASELKARIAFQGIEAEVRKTKGSNGTWYKVVLGPYPRKRAAERHRHVLQDANINGCQIWFWTEK